MKTKFQIEKLPNDDLKELSSLIGINNIVILCNTFGGTTLYIPKADIFNRQIRNINIVNDYKKGYTYNNLARKYNLTVVMIRNIIDSFL